MAKRYLDVSYDDRDLAKRLGAKWDPSVRRWYCPAGSPLAKIFKWRAEAKVNAAQKNVAQNNMAKIDALAPHESHRVSVNSDIHFKTAPMKPKPNLASQPAVNQNFELFMAS